RYDLLPRFFRCFRDAAHLMKLEILDPATGLESAPAFGQTSSAGPAHTPHKFSDTLHFFGGDDFRNGFGVDLVMDQKPEPCRLARVQPVGVCLDSLGSEQQTAVGVLRPCL